MGTCEVCGNDYDRSMTITVGDDAHIFDSFECAIQALAPTCGHCGCRVLGHGMQAGDTVYCSAHCAGQAGREGFRDRA